MVKTMVPLSVRSNETNNDFVSRNFAFFDCNDSMIFRPRILPGEDHVLVPLSVRSSETNKDFVSRNFAFFDCNQHSTCHACTSSKWACDWCVYKNICTPNGAFCKDFVVSGENVSNKPRPACFCYEFRMRNAERILW